MNRKTDYSFGIGKEIHDFIKHKLSNEGPYGLQLEISRIKGSRFGKPKFKMDIYTENGRGERMSLVLSLTFEEDAIVHITDVADSFKFQVS